MILSPPELIAIGGVAGVLGIAALMNWIMKRDGELAEERREREWQERNR